jgi:hypothetical protein
MKKSYIEKEKENIEQGILKLIRDNSKINVIIWLLLALLGISFLSTLSQIQILSFITITFIVAFIIVKKKYSNTIEELTLLKKKLK